MGETDLSRALRPWERRLVSEALRRWLLRGATAGLLIASLVLLVGWMTPLAEETLRPWAAELAVPPLIAAASVALWPARRIRAAAALDTRLGFGDRLASAWAFRASDAPIARLQRADALARLQRRSPATDLNWQPSRLEVGALGAVAVLATLLAITPSPQRPILERHAAEQLAVQQAADRLEAMRLDAASAASLTPEQARRLDELLQQAQLELARVQTQQAATAIVARTAEQLSQQLADPNAELRDEALAAMSETLAAEPLTRALADALQHEDAQATSDALNALATQADQLSDVQRQALSRALQRAANVGRADPRSASALRDAARAIGSGDPAEATLASADAALREAIQAATAQTAVQSAAQRLRDLEAQLASGKPLSRDNPNDLAQPAGAAGQAADTSRRGAAASGGTPVALDNGRGSSALVRDPAAAGRGSGAGVGAAGQSGQADALAAGGAAENVFVPGRAGDGSVDRGLTDQPFTVRGAPRPYREVLSQYAQSGRDYVDRPDVSPAVRELVKQYFQRLEEGQ